MTRTLIIFLSIVASVILGVLSNWLYDLLRARNIFLDKPNVKRLVIICIASIPFILLVSLPDLSDDAAENQHTSFVENNIQSGDQSKSINVEGDVVDSTIIQSDKIDAQLLYAPTSSPIPGPSPTVNAYSVHIPELPGITSDDIVAEVLYKNLDGFGTEEIILKLLPRDTVTTEVKIFSYLPKGNQWLEVFSRSDGDIKNSDGFPQICGLKFDILNLKQNNTRQLVLYQSCGTGRFVYFEIYDSPEKTQW